MYNDGFDRQHASTIFAIAVSSAMKTVRFRAPASAPAHPHTYPCTYVLAYIRKYILSGLHAWLVRRAPAQVRNYKAMRPCVARLLPTSANSVELKETRNEDGMAKEQGTVMIAQNRKARHDYSIEDTYEAGLVLTGTEVKSLREGRASLAEAFVSIDRRGEMWLEAANIPEYLNGTWNNHAPKRKRKLLLHAAQIEKLQRQTQAKGYTIIPLSLYFKDGRVKAEIALARGKKEYDKRQALREEQDKREALRIMRYKNKQVI